MYANTRRLERESKRVQWHAGFTFFSFLKKKRSLSWYMHHFSFLSFDLALAVISSGPMTFDFLHRNVIKPQPPPEMAPNHEFCESHFEFTSTGLIINSLRWTCYIKIVKIISGEWPCGKQWITCQSSVKRKWIQEE